MVEYSLFGKPVPAVIGIPIGIVTVLVIVVLSPLLIPLHVVLRRCGRLGFIVNQDDTWRIAIELDSFKAA